MTLLSLLLAAFYAAMSAFVWRFGRPNAPQHYPLKGEMAVLIPALLAHAAAVWLPVVQQQAFLSGFGYALSMVTWLMLMLYWGGSFFYPLKGLQLLLYPLAALGMLAAALLPQHTGGTAVAHLPFVLHITASLLSYSLFGIAALFAWLILLLDRDLRRHRFSPLVSFLPPLLSLEKLMFQSMLLGFVLLTVSALSGTVFAPAVFGHPMAWTHKTVFGLAAWLIYAMILLLHRTRRWRGRKAACWCLAGFASLMLAYIGSKFVLQVLLQRG
ncbi:inner membrane protein YpjD [Neisseria shayeganii]|uniref:Cytochrome c assembly family protein n=1 Tax=Neisseria shayeganii 871 TaxID=1032488 RepID=G4CKQ9_9NEIS|nr:cytochrome c biogenesis protein CcsA [Neisseria shayeganii]EGY51592.1 cytochrome c assembly family protein [Neisseria shayeganii 871]